LRDQEQHRWRRRPHTPNSPIEGAAVWRSGDGGGTKAAIRPWLMKRNMLRWSIIPEHIPWENRGVDPEKRNTPIEKGLSIFRVWAFASEHNPRSHPRQPQNGCQKEA
jgi:hypothetical protein